LSLKSVIAGLLLAASGIGALAAQDAAAVVLVEYGGKVCVGGTDVIWVVSGGKVMRWRQRDGALSEIQLPDLGHIDRAQGGILGCLVRPDDSIDLYYEEYFNIPGTRWDRVGWDENRRVQTIWLSGSRHRALLTISVPEGGHVDDAIRIVPELGVTVHGRTVERISDGLRYDIELPDGAAMLGVWPTSRKWPVDPPELLVCYAYPRSPVAPGGCLAVRIGEKSMEQRRVAVNPRDINLMNREYVPVNAERHCTLKSTESRGYAWPDRATFDCESEQKSILFARYPIAKGWISWRINEINEICRQRHLGADAFIDQAQCFKPEGAELISALPSSRGYGGIMDGYEYPASEWTLSIFGPRADRPIIGRLQLIKD
jgi:hypothetical protein